MPRKSVDTFLARKVIERMMIECHVATDKSFASFLGVTTSNVSDARRRGVPEIWFYKVAYHKRCSLEYLREGLEIKRKRIRISSIKAPILSEPMAARIRTYLTGIYRRVMGWLR